MHRYFDSNGRPLRDGASVRLLRAPPELLSGLPEEDQQAIRWAAKEATLTLTGHDGYGNIELEFSDPAGVIHFIYVPPSHVAAV